MPRVVFADLELWLTGWLRAELAARPEPFCRGVFVSNREPGPDQGDVVHERMVIVRDDGGPRESVVTESRNVGTTVVAGPRDAPKEAGDLARVVRAIFDDAAGTQPGNPVAAVRASRGPYSVPDPAGRARKYMTHEMVCAGTPLP
ncbi:hypothetical protein [Sinomonas sp. ASV322]|uniref:hypothetical protein n=1 Tax=Sinomonas sp. ASV322 TaxID=3041920 RepID=UPI0027DABC06|nr:hypothetical protein [Sinomonas sp. ASV322]MDQ4502182.1 hypothetical protein [Sinomonas sp. ASV322]